MFLKSPVRLPGYLLLSLAVCVAAMLYPHASGAVAPSLPAYGGHAASLPAGQTAGYRIGGLVWLFLKSAFAGLLAVFTPFIYTIMPFTLGYLGQRAKFPKQKTVNALIYAAFLVVIFTMLGIVLYFIVRTTNLQDYMDNWVVNLFFFRFIAVLGLNLLGAFNIRLPFSLVNKAATNAQAGSIKGIFYMALTLPVASFSSTGPIIGLVMVLAIRNSAIAIILALMGFSVGLGLPFVFPAIMKIFSSSKSLLNSIKVILGFFALVLSLKFLSNADISLGLHLIGRDMFIIIWILLAGLMGGYMMGQFSLPNDIPPEQNVYGQEYVSLLRLFAALVSFTFALYLLPGLWGAPLRALSDFLPS